MGERCGSRVWRGNKRGLPVDGSHGHGLEMTRLNICGLSTHRRDILKRSKRVVSFTFEGTGGLMFRAWIVEMV